MGHLTRNVTEDHIKEIFSTFGAIKSVELSVDKARTTLPELCFAIPAAPRVQHSKTWKQIFHMLYLFWAVQVLIQRILTSLGVEAPVM